MTGLGFQEKKRSRSGSRACDDSPDSVIYTQDSNFSLFSSTSGSVDRCSFASDVHDHEALVSEISRHFAGSERDHCRCSSGPDLDPNRVGTVNKNSVTDTKGEKPKEAEEEETEAEDDNRILDPPQESFSQALKECHNRRINSDAATTLSSSGRRRPASFDLNNRASNVTSSSPRLEVMKKSTVSSRRSGAFPSPGTPNYRHGTVMMQKGWSSERVPLPVNGSRRYASAALLPLNSGRTLPSKWEDAEKWICSPVSGDGVIRSSLPHPQRRPKSKSGPLGPVGIAYYSTYSPAMPMFEGSNTGNFMAGSPFSAGVLVTDGFTGRCVDDGGHIPACIMRSASVHGCSDMLSQSSLAGTQDTRPDGTKDAGTMVSRAVSRRDMATQMSPEGSTHSSPKGRPSFSPSPPPSFLPDVKLQSYHSTKSEIRDVQIDERVTVARWSRKHTTRLPAKGTLDAEDWRKEAAEAQVSAWEVSDTPKCMSKVKREEARITAWENLQKAKTEAAIRKLEMKLEKKRSSSMDRIMNKLKSAQRKAQEMRNSVSASQGHQLSQTSSRAPSFRRTRHLGSFTGCFTCHAF